MNRIFRYLVLSLIIFSCKENRKISTEGFNSYEEEHTEVESKKESDKEVDYKSLFANNPQYIAKDFDFPVTKLNVMGMRNFNMQRFGAKNNLGDNSNGVSIEEILLDKPVYAIGNGYISEAKEYLSKWGNVIKIVHLLDGNLYESIYAHCNKLLVKPHQFIKKGEQIGTIITCNKLYHTHLHFEIRDSLDMEIGRSNSDDTNGYLDPTDFIRKNRD
ncbi:M23 family metallopeptidase [Winogradskyella sp.]|uniref:M23 family metallopeptidase n=1 Tax=Winogradskyella sp. TaxID=1883156 RepID=UPI00260E7851|nr:M23 family metallopeptidase [Winogradskyella sp.]